MSWLLDSSSNLNIFSTYLSQAKYFLLNGFHCNLFIVSLACLCSNISSEAAKFRLYINPMFDTKKNLQEKLPEKSFLSMTLKSKQRNRIYTFLAIYLLSTNENWEFKSLTNSQRSGVHPKSRNVSNVQMVSNGTSYTISWSWVRFRKLKTNNSNNFVWVCIQCSTCDSTPLHRF